jgi:hypothetical protein
MRRSYVMICVGGAVALIAWIAIALLVAYSANWNYEDVADNGNYWGGVLGGGFAFLGNVLFFVALLMQRDELVEQRRQIADGAADVAESQRIARDQSEQIRKQAEVAQVATEFARIIPLLDLRSSLIATYYQQAGKTDTLVISQQIDLVDKALGHFVAQARVDEPTRAVLADVVGKVDLSSRSIHPTRLGPPSNS